MHIIWKELTLTLQNWYFIGLSLQCLLLKAKSFRFGTEKTWVTVERKTTAAKYVSMFTAGTLKFTQRTYLYPVVIQRMFT